MSEETLRKSQVVNDFLSTGIIFNISSLNLLLAEFTESVFVLPFVVGTPISLFWSIFCVIKYTYDRKFFSQFSFMPIAMYDSSFYDGIGYDPNNTSIHPFSQRFISANSFFENTFLILVILVVAASECQ